jgi:hypothetical protein
MAIELKPGVRLRSAVCETEVVVVRAPAGPVELRCGGYQLVPIAGEPRGGAPIAAAFAAGTKLGKRYTDEAGTIELLCTKAGTGSLSIGDTPMRVSGAKPLPASD